MKRVLIIVMSITVFLWLYSAIPSAAIIIITASAGAGGSISPSGSVAVSSGASKTFTITPDAGGWVVWNVNVDGASVGAVTTYTFTNVTANHTISATFRHITYTITATAGAGGSISPSGSVSVNRGANQTFTITPNVCYRILSVTVDGGSVGAVSTYTFSNVTANHTISATFVVITHTITASAGTGGSISPSGSVTVNQGANQTFTITPNTGYGISSVTVDGASVSVAPSYTFSNVTANHTISVTFVVLPKYTITATAGAGGSISPSGSILVFQGGFLTITITPNAGYRVADVILDGASLGARTTYMFGNVTANHTISATFIAVYTITASAGTGGSTSPSGSVTVDQGANQTFTITPNPGYSISSVTVDGTSVGAVSTYTFSNVTANHTISATFVVLPTYTITATAGAGGTISPSGSVSVVSGTSKTFTITPNSGYRISSVTVDGGSAGAVSTYTFSNVTTNHTISAAFIAVYTITASAGTGGSISPSGSVTVDQGASRTFNITTNPNQYPIYRISNVTVDGISVGAVSTYTFTNVNANHTISAAFIAVYTITASAGTGGSISPSGSVTVDQGASRTFTITPNTGYSISSVIVNGASVGTVSTYTFNNVTQNHTIYATFTASVNYTITATAGTGGSISPSGTVSVNQGANQTFTMTPNIGYSISNVTVNGGSVGAATSYTFSSVAANHTISVTFTVRTYTITASAGTGGSISPSGSVTVNHGSSQTFTVTANPGFFILGVSVDGTLVPMTTYTFSNVTANHTISATFGALPNYIITATAGIGGSMSPSGSVKVVVGTSQTFTITPNPGYRMSNVTVDGGSVGAVSTYTFTNVNANHTISVAFTGVYIITASAGAGGSISPAGSVSVDQGTSKTFTITPNAGYRVSNVTIDEGSAGVITTYTFSFASTTYTITASASTGGSITPSGLVTVNYGASQKFTITPNTGSNVTEVKVDGTSAGAVLYTFSNVTAGHTISAKFGVTSNIITATAGTGGSITPSGSVPVAIGGNQTFTITPNAGARVLDVKVDNTSVGAVPTYTFTNVTSSHTIAVTFDILKYTITASAGAGGIISPSGSATVNYGANQTFTVTPNTGYRVTDVKVDGASVGKVTTYTFSSVTADHTIGVTFEVMTYPIAASAGAGGSIAPTGTVTVNHGGNQTFTLTPNAGYRIKDVKVDNVSAGAVSTYKFNNVIANHKIDVAFEIIPYTITATAGTGGSINPSGSVTVNHGASQTFAITPNTGYRVTDVKVDGASVGAVTTYTFSNVTANHTIEVTFEVMTYPIAATTGAGGSISPAGTVTVKHSANQTYTINPSTGYRIKDVKIDNVSAGAVPTYTFSNVIANHKIEASFEILTYPIVATAGTGGSITPSGTMTVNHGASQTFTITPSIGYRVTDVKIDGVSVGAVSAYTFTNIAANHTIEVTFEVITYPITATVSTGGSISPTGTVTVKHGADQKFNINPGAGYRIKDVKVDNISVGAVSTYTFSNVVTNHKIEASFERITYTITATAGAGGSISPSGSVAVNHGASQTFTIAPGAGYRVKDVLVDNVSAGAISTYTFTNVTTNHKIDVSFKQLPVPVILSPAKDAILPAGTTSIDLQVSIPGYEDPWAWKMNDPFPDRGAAGGNKIISGYSAVITGLKDVGSYTVYVTLVDSKGIMLNPPITASVKFSVANTPYFDINASEAKSDESNAVYILTLEGKNDYMGKVMLNESKLPPNCKAQFSPEEISLSASKPKQNSQLTLTISEGAVPGDYQFSVYAIPERGETKTLKLSLRIEAPTITETRLFFILDPMDEVPYKGKVTVKGLLLSEKSSEGIEDAKIQITFTSPGRKEKSYEVKTKAGGSYQLATPTPFSPDELGDWKVKARYEGSALYKASEQNGSFWVVKAKPSIVFDTGTTGALGKEIMIQGHLEPPPGKQSLSIKIVRPDGSVKTTYNGITTAPDGTFHYNLLLDEPGDWEITLTWDGNKEYENTTGKHTITVIKEWGKVIIVLGGAGRLNTDWDRFNDVAEQVYKAFVKRGFDPDKDIYFLSPDPEATEGADHPTSMDELKMAIKWAAGQVNQHIPLYLYMISHGMEDQFLLVKDKFNEEYLTPKTLDELLDQIPEGVSESIIIEACYSGRFIRTPEGKPTELVGADRVIITSANWDKQARIQVNSDSFSRRFFESIKANKTIKDAFSEAQKYMERNRVFAEQSPQMDGNGDGQANQISDYTAMARFLPADFISAGAPPEIIWATDSQTLPKETSSLKIEAKIQGAGITDVYALVIPPDYDSSGKISNWSSLNFPKFNLDKVSGNAYAATYNRFTDPGDYSVVIYSENPDGGATPWPITVTVPGASATVIKGDVNGDGVVNSRDALLVARFAAGLDTPTEAQKLAADMNNDGKVDSRDTILILKKASGSAAPGIDVISSALFQNYPNPFNPETWIPYQLSEDSEVTIRIYSIKGEVIRQLDLGHKPAGLYIAHEKSAYWDGKNEAGEQVSSGIYFYSIHAGSYTATRKMIIAR